MSPQILIIGYGAVGRAVTAALLARGEPVRVGFLLGTRRYLASRPWFAEGETLEVTARLVLRDGPMAVFDCRISAGGGALASAHLTLYQPDQASGEPA